MEKQEGIGIVNIDGKDKLCWIEDDDIYEISELTKDYDNICLITRGLYEITLCGLPIYVEDVSYRDNYNTIILVATLLLKQDPLPFIAEGALVGNGIYEVVDINIG